jgi:hypothetical protein
MVRVRKYIVRTYNSLMSVITDQDQISRSLGWFNTGLQTLHLADRRPDLADCQRL